MANPQTNDVTNTQILQPLNAKWVNGIAPGYWPTNGGGLVLDLSAGSAFTGTAMISYAGGTLTMTNNTTNYVFLDSTSSYAPAVNTTGFTATMVPIATVVTSGGAITSIVDNRLAFTTGGGGGGGSTNRVFGFIINNGTAGTNVGPYLLAPAAGNVTKAEVIVKQSDPTVGLAFRIMQNGVNVFTVNPTVPAGTAPGTISSSTSLTTNPLSVSFNDKFSIDIITGSPIWAFTVQLET